jgi:hypothetical protein
MNDEVNEAAKALEFAHAKVDIAKALQRLRNSSDWKLVVEKGYFDDWALTQIRNVGGYGPEQLKGYVEQAKARGIFDDYLYNIEQEGSMAKEALPSLIAETEE